jgi:hypothetical protein
MGAATVSTLLPSEQLGIVVLTNGMPIGMPEAVSASFFDLVRKGKIEKDWLEVYRPAFEAILAPEYGKSADYSQPPAGRSPPLPLEAYVGTYHNDYFGDLEVVQKDKALVLLLGPKKHEFAMQHWDRDIFAYRPEGENAGGLSGVTLSVGPERRATRVVVENLDIRGLGTFKLVAAKK